MSMFLYFGFNIFGFSGFYSRFHRNFMPRKVLGKERRILGCLAKAKQPLFGVVSHPSYLLQQFILILFRYDSIPYPSSHQLLSLPCFTRLYARFMLSLSSIFLDKSPSCTVFLFGFQFGGASRSPVALCFQTYTRRNSLVQPPIAEWLVAVGYSPSCRQLPARPPRLSAITFLSYICRIYTAGFGQYWTMLFLKPVHPEYDLYAIPVRHTEILSPASFRFRGNPFPFANSSCCHACSGLSPPVIAPSCHMQKAQNHSILRS